MKFGISTWFFQELSVAEALERIARIGYRSAEIWAEHLLRTGEQPGPLGEAARRLGLDLTLHAPSYDLNPTALNSGIRVESMRQIEAAIVTARRLDAACVVVHPGRLSTERADRDKYWRDLEEMFEAVEGWATAAGVPVGIEAMERRAKELYMLPDDARRMLGNGRRNIGLTLDIAHAFTHMDPVRFIEEVEPDWIVHVHVSDGDANHTHLPLGKGAMDITSSLSALRGKYDGIVSIEGYVPGRGDEVAREDFDYLRRTGWV